MFQIAVQARDLAVGDGVAFDGGPIAERILAVAQVLPLSVTAVQAIQASRLHPRFWRSPHVCQCYGPEPCIMKLGTSHPRRGALEVANMGVHNTRCEMFLM